MASQKELLETLGACDTATQALMRSLSELPKSIAETEAKAQTARDVIQSERKRIEDAEKTRRAKEAELADCEAQRDKYQSQTAMVKTNEEYSALLSEIDGRRTRISQLEEEILLAMETIDQIGGRLKDVEREQRQVEQESVDQAARLREQMEEVRRQIELREQEREGLLAELGPEVKPSYERVRARRGTGTALVQKHICTACHRQVPPETVNRVLAGEVHTCGSCQRILFALDA